MPTYPTLAHRLAAKIQVDPTGCWLWTGSKSRGYGQFQLDGRLHPAHRITYENRYGPIPEGLTLDHLCRVRHCVRPSHLEAVTHKVNIRRGETGKHNARKTHCPKGHEYNAENTRMCRGWRHCRTCDRASGAHRRYARMKEERHD